jgi:DNA-binding NarL/FixJ family response regulator
MITNQSKRHTVLIADDHYLVGEAFSQFLEQSGLYETTLVRDVLEARAELRVNGPFDIVLVDLFMPGMTGPETIAELVQLNAGGRVVVLTGGNSRFRQSAIFGAGASGLILKSQPAQQITEALQSILDGEIYFPLADDRLLDRVISNAC